jgi:hypothetical protein
VLELGATYESTDKRDRHADGAPRRVTIIEFGEFNGRAHVRVSDTSKRMRTWHGVARFERTWRKVEAS